jgi:hypothetical protein
MVSPQLDRRSVALNPAIGGWIALDGSSDRPPASALAGAE